MSVIHKIIILANERRLKIVIKEGIRFRIYLPVIRYYNLLLDNYYRIDTEIRIELSSLGIDDNIGHRHESTSIRHITKIMKTLNISEGDVFLDVGSGKGRVLLVAGRYPFKKIIGVDVSSEINKICQENVRRMKSKLKCNNIQTITSNAANFKIPKDITHVYFFNRFGLNVMKSVIDSIYNSITNYPRKIVLIYYNPKFEKEIESIFSIERLKEIKWHNCGLFDSRCIIYEIGNI
jgi:precorrin-6B methylase 2